jgi:hypothetical protein
MKPRAEQNLAELRQVSARLNSIDEVLDEGLLRASRSIPGYYPDHPVNDGKVASGCRSHKDATYEVRSRKKEEYYGSQPQIETVPRLPLQRDGRCGWGRPPWIGFCNQWEGADLRNTVQVDQRRDSRGLQAEEPSSVIPCGASWGCRSRCPGWTSKIQDRNNSKPRPGKP